MLFFFSSSFCASDWEDTWLSNYSLKSILLRARDVSKIILYGWFVETLLHTIISHDLASV